MGAPQRVVKMLKLSKDSHVINRWKRKFILENDEVVEVVAKVAKK